MSEELEIAHAEIERLRAFLKEIEKGAGRYSMDQLEHAGNTIEDMIEDMKELATKGLAGDSI